MTAAGNVLGFLPVTELGMAKGIAADLAPAGSGLIRGALANATGSAAEGASANYLAALGHGASAAEAEKQGLWGGIFGAPIGAASEIGGARVCAVWSKAPEVWRAGGNGMRPACRGPRRTCMPPRRRRL